MGHKRKKLDSKAKTAIILLAVLGLGFVAFFFLFPLAPFSSTPTTGNSSFIVISYTDGDDVSPIVPIKVYLPNSAKFAISGYTPSAIRTLTNFDAQTVQMANVVSLNCTPYSHIWIEIDPANVTVFANTFYLVTGGANSNFSMYGYHQSSDVNFNILDSETMNDANYQSVDSNYTVIMDFPHRTTSSLHKGVGWTITDAIFNAYTTAQKEVIYDEANYRCQAPTYSPSLDTLKSGDVVLSKITNAFALKFTMNDTISLTDGAYNQANITITTELSAIEIVTQGVYLYMIFTETFSVKTGPKIITYEAIFAENGTNGIGITTVHSGRVNIPKASSNLGTFTALSAITA